MILCLTWPDAIAISAGCFMLSFIVWCIMRSAQ